MSPNAIEQRFMIMVFNWARFAEKSNYENVRKQPFLKSAEKPSVIFTFNKIKTDERRMALKLY